MQYTSTTPLPIDPDHVVNVLGRDRFTRCLALPVSEWGLTTDEIERLKRGPHGQKSVYILDTEYMGFTVSLWQIECECGHKITDRLVSHALRAHDTHAGIAATSHIHTAEMLEA